MVRHGGSGIGKSAGKGIIDVQALLPFVSPLVKASPVLKQFPFNAKKTIDLLVTTLTLFTISRQTSIGAL